MKPNMEENSKHQIKLWEIADEERGVYDKIGKGIIEMVEGMDCGEEHSCEGPSFASGYEQAMEDVIKELKQSL